MNNTGELLGRLLRIITMIQGDRRWRPASIAEHLGVSIRTAHRDIQRLQAGGIPIKFDDVAGGYYITHGFFLPPIDLTAEEACALLMLADRVGGADQLPLTRPAAAAMEKLKAGLPHVLRDAVNEVMPRVSFHLAAAEHEGVEDVWSVASRAISERATLRCVYEAANGNTPTHHAPNGSPQPPAPPPAARELFDFDPYHLYFGQRAWYLIGHHHGRGRPRTLRLARFASIQPTDRSFDPPPPEVFSLDTYFGQAWRMIPGDRVPRRVVLRFSPQVADTVAETCWHRSQDIDYHDDGSITATFTLEGLDEIVWWILGYGPHCEVVEPVELREKVAGMLREAAQRYSP